MKRKKILALFLSFVLALGIAGCGVGSGGKSSGRAASNPSSNENDTSSVSSDDSAGDFTTTSTWKPSGTVSIIVPAGAGGNTDLSAHVFADQASKITGATFVVVNANGASGSVAADQVLEATPDGNTCLYGHTLVNMAYIAGVTDYNYTAFKLGPTFAKDPAQQLYVNAEKYPDLNAFLDAARAEPGSLRAVIEEGAYTYYELLAFERAAGIDLDLIDGGSNAEKITGMLGGQYDLMPGSYINCKEYLASGLFSVLGVPSEERFDLIPDIPTFKEQGIDLVYPDCDFSFYFPPDTPDEVITYYEDLVQYIISTPEGQAGIASVDMQPYYLSGADSGKNDEVQLNYVKEIADSLAG